MKDTSKPKILVVDDEEPIRELLSEVLAANGFPVLTACDGLEAIRVATREKPALVLLDIKMPNLDGMETCRRLRQEPSLQNLRIIMLTAFDTRDRLEESIVAGADDFLGKPINLTELEVRVKSMLMVRNMEDEVERLEAYIISMKQMRSAQT